MTWNFAFFFLSGFCGILNELVWMRLSMAQFGVTAALTPSCCRCLWQGWVLDPERQGPL